MKRAIALALMLATASAVPLQAEVIGQMTSAEPLTDARVAILPAPERKLWADYLARSRAQMANDRAALRAERAKLTGALPASPPAKSGTVPLDKDAAWYAGDEAKRVADNIVSFQTPTGGWGKNQDRSGPPRVPGQMWVISEKLPTSAADDIKAEDTQFAFVGTIDNGATTSEMRFLARAQAARPGAAGQPYRDSFLRGLAYLLEAQYPNGGWPQIYPLQGGYHDAVTYNDDSVVDVVNLLMAAAARKGDYAFVPEAEAAKAGAAVARAVDLILTTQLVIDGKRTGWGQQHDPLTLVPVGARNFEPVALSSGESTSLLALLMRLPQRTPTIDAAIRDGVEWLRSAAIRDVEWTRDTSGEGRRLVTKPGAGPIWARFYDMETMRPIFGDRDKSIHDDVNELSLERRNGYSWFGTQPAKVIAAYDKAQAAK